MLPKLPVNWVGTSEKFTVVAVCIFFSPFVLFLFFLFYFIKCEHHYSDKKTVTIKKKYKKIKLVSLLGFTLRQLALCYVIQLHRSGVMPILNSEHSVHKVWTCNQDSWIHTVKRYHFLITFVCPFLFFFIVFFNLVSVNQNV